MNWGIVSTANIANRRCKEIKKNNGTLLSVSSRSKAKSVNFKNKNGIKAVSNNHDELIANKGINFIYLPIPCSLRFSYVEKICLSKKHLLCEKPVCNNLEEMREICKLVKKHNIAFLDATDFLYNPNLVRFRHEISNFNKVSLKLYLGKDNSFKKNNIRMNKGLEPLGCLGDIGWYAIRWALFLYDEDVEDVIVIERIYINGVISEIKAKLIFNNGKEFTFDCSFFKKKTQELIVSNNETILLKTKDIFKLGDTKYKDDVFGNARLIQFFIKNRNNKGVINRNLDQLIKVYEVIERIIN